MLTNPLKSSHHLYLCCLSHEHGPSPSSPSDRGTSLCQSNSTFESSAHGACPNTCQRDDRDDPATGMMVLKCFRKKHKEKPQICSTAGIFIITCYSFQEFHAEFKSLPMSSNHLDRTRNERAVKNPQASVPHIIPWFRDNRHGAKNMESFEPPGNLHSRWHLFGDSEDSGDSGDHVPLAKSKVDDVQMVPR